MDSRGRITVLHLILTLERAGAQEVVRLLAEKQDREICRQLVCTFQDGSTRADLENLGIPVTVLPPRRRSIENLPGFFAEHLAIRRRLAELVRRQGVDIVQAHLLQTLDFLALTLPLGTPVRAVLLTMHNTEYLPEGRCAWTRLKRQGHRLLYRAARPWIGRFIAVSAEVAGVLERDLGRPYGKVALIPNGVDPDPFDRPGDKPGLLRELGLPPESTLVLTLGRLSEQKGHRYLVEAAPAVLEHFPHTHFLFVYGVADNRPELEEGIGRLGLERNFHFLGERRDVPRLLAAADLFVLPSLWEGLSLALLEAMAAGLPLVVTAAPGSAGMVEPGREGLVVPPRDPAALARAMLQLLARPERAAAMGARARRRVVTEHGAERNAAAHLALYRQVLGLAGLRRRDGSAAPAALPLPRAGGPARVTAAWRTLTAPVRMLPHFLIIGAQRCGTTSLYRYLEKHPSLLPAGVKEVHFFDLAWHRGLGHYRSFFPTRTAAGLCRLLRGTRSVTGEASPYYGYHPLVPERVARCLPAVRLIMLVRDPAERAWSHYRHSLRLGLEECRSFGRALELEEERLAGEEEKIRADHRYHSYSHQHHSYCARGYYLDQLRRWETHFPRERILVLATEELGRDPAGTMRRVLEFLGLPDQYELDYPRFNQGGGPPLDPAMRRRLEQRFARPNRKLEVHLGVDFGWGGR